MDGFLGGQQSRPGLPPVQPSSRHSGLSIDRFRGGAPGGRQIGDFKRPEGYHPAPHAPALSQSPSQKAPATIGDKPAGAKAQPQASILNMTLPGGFADQAARAKGKGKTKHHGRWHTFRKWSKRSALILTALVVLGGGFLGIKAYSKLHKVFKGGGTAAALQAEVTPELLKGEGDGRVNVLLLGKGGENHDGPDLTDTILVASIDPLNKQVYLVSIPRDLWVTVGSSSSKINAVYANAKYKSLAQDSKDTQKAEQAGMTAISQQVTQVLGIPIHYYGIVDFSAFQKAVDTVGGVTVNAPEELVDYTMAWENNNNPVLAKQGEQTFDGNHALMYVRSRHGSARGDFDRTERQRLFIQALSEKVLSANTYTNPVKVTQLMDTFGDHVSTDFSIGDLLRLTSILKGADLSKMQSIGLADPPNNFVQTDAVGNQSVVRPRAGFGDYSEIQAYIRNTLRDPYIAKEGARLTVLNGTTIDGLATQKGEELQSYGYNVVKLDTAPTQSYTKTMLIDVSGGKKPYTKSYLEKRLGVKTTTTVPEGVQTTGTDFVIILGQDE